MSILDVAEAAARVKAMNPLPHLIGRQVPLQRDGRNWCARCPFHGEKTPSFYVYADHFHCFGCGAHGDAITWTMRTQRMNFAEALGHLGAEDRKPARPLPMPTAPQADKSRNLELARRIWTSAVDPIGSPVETYLRSRGVGLPDAPVIRFHPHCPRTGGALPAMVALMVDPITGEPCGLHRTFIRPDGSGKAAVTPAKMMIGGAGIVRLAEPFAEGLGLSEGIETALSAMQKIGWGPVWAAGSRGGIERFPVLPGHALTIFADGDAPGLAAARACAKRWATAGHEASIWAAPQDQDWNDAVRSLAA